MTSLPASGMFSAVRLFGSKARGDADCLSDTDVLVVSPLSCTLAAKTLLLEEMTARLNADPAVGWYEQDKIVNMYKSGDLFAWHIHTESLKIGYTHRDFLDDMVPAAYRTAVRDIETFLEIVQEVHLSLKSAPGNASYEAGVLFMASRNIAMSASWSTRGNILFGRRSPFLLHERTGIAFPISERDHEENMKARSLGYRGIPMVGRLPSLVANMADQILRWGERVLRFTVRSNDGSV